MTDKLSLSTFIVPVCSYTNKNVPTKDDLKNIL